MKLMLEVIKTASILEIIVNKYPLDNQAIEDISRDVLAHHRAQNEMITKLVGFLLEAMGDEDMDWHDAQVFLKTMGIRKNEYENHRFNQKNGYNTKANSPYAATPQEIGVQIAPMEENRLNALEAESGPEMSEEDLAAHFNVPVPKRKSGKSLNKMSLEEINEWEAQQNNSSDIYKVQARIKNIARSASGGNLTAQGDMLVNSFTHVVKAFYDFAETIEDKDTKIKLIELTKKQEEIPGSLISALGAGVKIAK